jgi:penicillin-binding protein 1A
MKKNNRTLFGNMREALFRVKLLRNHPWMCHPLLFFCAVFLVGAVMIVLLSRNLPSLTTLEHYDPQLVTRIYSADGKVLQELYMENRDQVPIDRMPDNLIQATVATEDRLFFKHWGLDLKGIARATVVNMAALRIKQGAGTLTGQLARKLYLTPEKKWSRKIREALTVLQIERTYSKSEIMEMYLNHMFFENRAYGVQAAALRYFGKNVEELKVEESAMLVGILQRPARYNPYKYPDAALQRRNLVLRNMVECNFLSREAADSLEQIGLNLRAAEEKNSSIAPYFCEYVRRQMEEKYGIRLVTDGLSIYTTLDTRVQSCAEKAVNDKIPLLEKQIRRRILNKSEYAQWIGMQAHSSEANALLSDSTRIDSLMAAKATLQVALVAMDPGFRIQAVHLYGRHR